MSELSAQLAMTSFSWFGENGDPYEDAVGDTGHNMKNMLTSMGFTDVQTNRYCQTDTLTDSVGVAIGRRIISVGNNDYTLLAIPIRSSGYKREWVGNLTVGNGNFVKGFKDARDEVLRFAKQYVSKYGITGNVKIWVTGHSRGAAVANMVGGFFADGGATYLGNDVSVTPKDVYCYCYAPPATIKAGASKAEALSVSAARGGAYQGKDTPGKAYVSKAKGTETTIMTKLESSQTTRLMTQS